MQEHVPDSGVASLVDPCVEEQISIPDTCVNKYRPTEGGCVRPEDRVGPFGLNLLDVVANYNSAAIDIAAVLGDGVVAPLESKISVGEPQEKMA